MTICPRHALRLAIIIAVATTITAAADTAAAQSNYYAPTPAQGPPPHLSVNSPGLPIDLLITHHCCTPTGAQDGVYDQIDQAVTSNNESYGTALSGAIVTATKTRYPPWMYQTQYTDRPNQSVVLISYLIKYDITAMYSYGLFYPFSRNAGQSIDIQISCEGWYPWYQGKGELTLTSIVSAVTLDSDHSVLEDTFGGTAWRNVIPSYIDGQITSKLSRFPRGTHRMSLGLPCNTLGTTTIAGNPALDQVRWDYVPPKTAVSAAQQSTIAVTQVRRLPVHDVSNNPVYYPVESPRLELYAGYRHLVVSLPPMQEGQVYVPDSSAVVSSPLPPATTQYSGPFVVIVNMWQVPQNIEDSTFLVFDKTTNFGAGTRTVDTPKIWWYLDPTVSRKPIIVYSNGYEVTLQVSGPPTLVTR
jgi:hypothetical protein